MTPNEPEQIEALFAAVEIGDQARVESLLKTGVDVNVYNKWNVTPLGIAARHGHMSMFFALVDAGANLHGTRGDVPHSVLCDAVRGSSRERLKMVQTIVADGMRLEDRLGAAFGIACRLGSVEIVRELLGAGADPNHSEFPLRVAVETNRPDVVAELIDAGADIHKRIPRDAWNDSKHKGMTLIEVAQAEGFVEVVRLLEGGGAKLPQKLNSPDQPPSVGESWCRISTWIKVNATEWKPLKRRVTEKMLDSAERKLGFRLPEELRGSYQTFNGSISACVFPSPEDISFYYMPLAEVADDWNMMKSVLERGDFSGASAEAEQEIRNDWWNVGWIPFACNGAGDYYCVDTNPAKSGSIGQVIYFRHDSGRRSLIARSLQTLLFDLANNVEDGRHVYSDDEMAII